ncbi:hypothetical protein G6011_02436 [Alternaria panax]|uniref:C2H2-type domain-containing protein n=1 Tax=Alternaria panax TaxID=48097 RepID=A0AAD4FEJ8_9PLEO|nr:hypothetical protein G6011_02436 [Alternaria panax]
MDGHQFRDLPQIEAMDDSCYPIWAAEHMNYMQPCKERIVHFHTEDETYLDDYDNGVVSMQPMHRFMVDQNPLTPGMLYAKIPFLDGRYEKLYEHQWPRANLFRNVSPDRTSSGNTSQNTQDELRSPHMCHSNPYGSPMKYSQLSLSYPPVDYIEGGAYQYDSHIAERNISLRELEYDPAVPEAVVENVDVVMRQETTCNHQHTAVKDEATPDYRTHANSGIRHSVRDAQSVEPVNFPEEPASDSDYSPSSNRKRRRSTTSNSGSGRTIKRRKPVRKDSLVPSLEESVKSERKPQRASKTSKASTEPSIQAEDRRAFPCPLAGYGCTSNFSSKNEWKRHVSTQHIKLGYWRCDLCPPSTDSNDAHTLYYNEFNRKDLFTQHLRRMHAAPKDKSCRAQRDYPVSEENLSKHQARCNLRLRDPPQHSTCLFCERIFVGATSWEERMEHVGRHLEKDGSRLDMHEPATWNVDGRLERYLIDEGLIARDGAAWKIGDGKPRRSPTADSDADSEED